jgi:ribonuclease HI/quercetin dioxygenase-like cupin family protein
MGHVGGALQVVELLEIEPGGFTPVSAHAEEHVMFVIAGTGEMSGAVGGGPTVVLRPETVVHVGHREVHQVRNNGSALLRVLVSTPLLVRSDRALGLTSAQEPAQTHTQPAPAPPQVEPRGTAAGRLAESKAVPIASPEVGDSETSVETEAEPEPPPRDISSLVKRASEVAASPRAERRKVAPLPEVEPEPQAAEGEGEGEEEDAPSTLMELSVVFDGGSRGNPGQGYGSYMVQSPNRKPVVRRVEFGDNYTNNQAEYESLIAGLEYIIERLEATNRSPDQVALDIKTDSDLVVNQLNGSYKVKDAGLKARHAKAVDLLDRFGAWIISWHEREESVRLLGH